MYRICKVLNHNGVIAIDMNNSKEYVLLGKGVGFGKKPGERFEQPVDCTVYSLQETSSRGDAADLIKDHPTGIFSDGKPDSERGRAAFWKN